MIVVPANSTHAVRGVQCFGLLLAVLNGMQPQIVNADETVKPLGWERYGNLEMIAWLPFETSSGDRRVLRVVREELQLDRDPTEQEEAARRAFVYSKDPRDADLLLPNNTFQHRSEQFVFWVLDCAPNQNIEQGRPLGVVYAKPGPCGPIAKNFAADLLWHASREQFLLTLSMSCSKNLTIAIFPVDVDAKLQIKPFGIAGKFRAEWPRPESRWPKPLAPIAEMRTMLPIEICDIMAIRVIPETRRVKHNDDDTEGDEERNLLIPA